MIYGSRLMFFAPVVLPVCFALALFGAGIVPDVPSRIVLGTTLILPAVFFFVVHFESPNWGLVYSPNLLALAPLGFYQLQSRIARRHSVLSTASAA